jgi:glucose uptake protein GlcU
MGVTDYPFALSFVFLFLSVILLTQAGITIYTYSKDKKEKDLNYYWSCLVLVFAIVGVLASGVSMAFHHKSAIEVVAAPAPVVATSA